jgi:enoyl-[acyl-carrier protein] reductase II
MNLRTPICDLFEIEHPIFLAGMGGVALGDVCAAVSEAGGYGTLGMAGQDGETIRAEMRKVRKLTQRPFGVDLLAALPEHMMQTIDVIIEEGASSFIAGLGVPEPVIEKCHRGGLKVVSMCGKVSHAVRAQEAGCDVVVAQGTEAGGHTGQVAGMALIPQIADAVDIPVLAAGSIIDGRGLAVALAFGAQGIWVGTRFIASHEANAVETYKKRITEIRAEDTRITRSYSGKPMRVIKNQWVEEWEEHPEDIQPFPQQLLASAAQGGFGAMSGRLDQDVDPEVVAMPCGQGAGGIRDIRSCKEIVDDLMREARETIERIAGLL